MNWEAVGAIGEVGGSIAVLATLVYLALQVRQNTAALRAGAAQAVSESLNQVNLTDASSLVHARVVRLAFEDPGAMNEDERSLCDYLCLASCRALEAALLQAELGTLDADTAEMVDDNFPALFGSDYFRDWWQRTNYPFTRRFRRAVVELGGIEAS